MRIVTLDSSELNLGTAAALMRDVSLIRDYFKHCQTQAPYRVETHGAPCAAVCPSSEVPGVTLGGVPLIRGAWVRLDKRASKSVLVEPHPSLAFCATGTLRLLFGTADEVSGACSAACAAWPQRAELTRVASDWGQGPRGGDGPQWGPVKAALIVPAWQNGSVLRYNIGRSGGSSGTGAIAATLYALRDTSNRVSLPSGGGGLLPPLLPARFVVGEDILAGASGTAAARFAQREISLVQTFAGAPAADAYALCFDFGAATQRGDWTMRAQIFDSPTIEVTTP